MKITIVLFLILLSVHSYSQDVVPEVETVTRDGLIYHQLSTEPLTGTVVSFHEDGRLQYKTNYKDGELHGLSEGFYENGQLEFRLTYKDGKRDGLWKSYHINGQLRGSGSSIDGKQDGVYVWFDSTGVPFMTRTYKNGVEVE
jgi:antitoxin component YwqK of YwqJK toxin-antitoxin module